MDIGLGEALKALAALFKLGLAGYQMWKEESSFTRQVEVLRDKLDLMGRVWRRPGGDPDRKGVDRELAALHLAVVTRCFGQAFGRHWAYNEKLAPEQPGLLARLMKSEEHQRAEQIQVRMRYAANELPVPGNLPAGRQEWELVGSLAGSPLSTPFYKALWRAFSDPRLEAPEEGEPPLLELGENGRLEFERHFQLACYHANASPTGQLLRTYLKELGSAYQPQLL
jgi:hypothetical protein